MKRDPHRPDLPIPTEPNWGEIDGVVKPYMSDSELKSLLKKLIGRVKYDWKTQSVARWPYNSRLLFHSDFGFLKKVLKRLKQAKGDIKKAKELISDIPLG